MGIGNETEAAGMRRREDDADPIDLPLLTEFWVALSWFPKE